MYNYVFHPQPRPTFQFPIPSSRAQKVSIRKSPDTKIFVLRKFAFRKLEYEVFLLIIKRHAVLQKLSHFYVVLFSDVLAIGANFEVREKTKVRDKFSHRTAEIRAREVLRSGCLFSTALTSGIFQMTIVAKKRAQKY